MDFFQPRGCFPPYKVRSFLRVKKEKWLRSRTLTTSQTFTFLRFLFNSFLSLSLFFLFPCRLPLLSFIRYRLCCCYILLYLSATLSLLFFIFFFTVFPFVSFPPCSLNISQSSYRNLTLILPHSLSFVTRVSWIIFFCFILLSLSPVFLSIFHALFHLSFLFLYGSFIFSAYVGFIELRFYFNWLNVSSADSVNRSANLFTYMNSS